MNYITEESFWFMSWEKIGDSNKYLSKAYYPPQNPLFQHARIQMIYDGERDGGRKEGSQKERKVKRRGRQRD